MRLVGLGGEREAGLEPEPPVRLANLAEKRPDLVGQLVRAHVDVGVVLDELADAGQAGQGPGALVAVEPAVLVQPERQVAVGPQAAGR